LFLSCYIVQIILSSEKRKKAVSDFHNAHGLVSARIIYVALFTFGAAKLPEKGHSMAMGDSTRCRKSVLHTWTHSMSHTDIAPFCLD
jgi:hypothetical protein